MLLLCIVHNIMLCSVKQAQERAKRRDSQFPLLHYWMTNNQTLAVSIDSYQITYHFHAVH